MTRFKIISVLCILIFCLPAQTFAKDRESGKTWECGVKAGVSAPFVYFRHPSINNTPIEYPSIDTQVGYIFSIFTRANIKKHFIQIEASTSLDNTHMNLDYDKLFPNQTQPYSGDQLRMTNTLFSVEVPLLYGYNFIKSKPYELCFMIGPSLKYIFKDKKHFGNITNGEIIQNVDPWGWDFTVGLSTRISSFIIDFRYKIGLTPYVQNIDYYSWQNSNDKYTGNAQIERVMNQLSFSVGFIF